jgi:hypothetical protein
MAIPESTLETWSHQGSKTQSATTYQSIKAALEAQDASYASRDFEVFLQGSYGNDTNIYAESDVDVVIRLDKTYFYDTSALPPAAKALFDAQFEPATYLYADYKADVVAALTKKFGNDVVPDSKAVKVRANAGRRSADVVVATEFRRYYQSGNGIAFIPGICFFTPDGQRIVNYPKQHSVNCTTKHQATKEQFKPLVRIFKNMRRRLAESGAIGPKTAPSYFVEGLLHNVPNPTFGGTFGDAFVAAFNWIIAADSGQYMCANGQLPLIQEATPTCWPAADYDAFLRAVGKMWTDWE